MRVVVITRHGGPEVLEVQERPDPAPGPGEVLIDVRAAGVNFADTMARAGLYAPAPKPPAVVGDRAGGSSRSAPRRAAPLRVEPAPDGGPQGLLGAAGRAAGPAPGRARGAGDAARLQPHPPDGGAKAVIGLNMLALWDDRGTLEPWIAPLRERIDTGVVRPVIAAEVPFADAPEAHRMLAQRRNVGKVVLVP